MLEKFKSGRGMRSDSLSSLRGGVGNILPMSPKSLAELRRRADSDSRFQQAYAATFAHPKAAYFNNDPVEAVRDLGIAVDPEHVSLPYMGELFIKRTMQEEAAERLEAQGAPVEGSLDELPAYHSERALNIWWQASRDPAANLGRTMIDALKFGTMDAMYWEQQQ